jgi:hypothetical protein
MQVHKLFNPTPEQFLEAQRAVQPNFLYIQGQQQEDEKEIGSLVWGDNDVPDPRAFSSLISPPFPTIVSTKSFSSVCKCYCMLLKCAKAFCRATQATFNRMVAARTRHVHWLLARACMCFFLL